MQLVFVGSGSGSRRYRLCLPIVLPTMPQSMDSATDSEVLEALVEPVPVRSQRLAWAAFAISLALLFVGLVTLGFQGNLDLKGAPDKVLGLSDGSFACGEMKCTIGSVCCGGSECCSAGSGCCGGTCLAPGGICCRNRTDAPLLCTPGTNCCGKDTDTAQCCTTGCADGPFVACKLPK